MSEMTDKKAALSHALGRLGHVPAGDLVSLDAVRDLAEDHLRMDHDGVDFVAALRGLPRALSVEEVGRRLGAALADGIVRVMPPGRGDHGMWEVSADSYWDDGKTIWDDGPHCSLSEAIAALLTELEDEPVEKRAD